LTDAEITALSPLRLPPVAKPLAIFMRIARRANARAADAPDSRRSFLPILEGLRRPEGKPVRAALDLASKIGGPACCGNPATSRVPSRSQPS
jgi:hypothetical protein